MLPLASQKHWMVKILASTISILPTFQCYLENFASINACFPLFHSPFFYFKIYAISTNPTAVGISLFVS